MKINIVDIKPLRGGKAKVVGADNTVYYTEAGVNVMRGETECDVAEVVKDGKPFNVIKSVAAPVQPIESIPVPSLPVTSLPETKAPGGELPVKKAGANVKNVDSDRMSRQDWADKERRIELVALMKSAIESPAFRELVIGKNTDEALKTFDVLVDHYVDKLEELKGR